MPLGGGEMKTKKEALVGLLIEASRDRTSLTGYVRAIRYLKGL